MSYSSAEQKYAGATSIKVVQNAWGGLSVHNGTWAASVGINPALYSRFEFAINGGTTGGSIAVMFENDQGSSFPKVNYGTIPANQWVVISLPMSQLDPGNQTIHRVDIMEMSGTTRTYYVDNVRLVGTASSATSSSPVGESPATVNAGRGVPTEYNLRQNYPNPFNPSTTIEFDLPSREYVTLKVYNALGQEVASLVDENRSEGRYSVVWNANDMPSGFYIYRLRAGSFTQTKKLELVK